MIGKINYKSGSLTQLPTYSSLPSIGSKTTTYYVEDENAFYIFNNSNYIRLKTKPTNWYIKTSTIYLSDAIAEETIVQINDLQDLENKALTPDIGDYVYDIVGTCGMITEKVGASIKVRTLEAGKPRKVTYPDNSWEMWLSRKDGGGHYFWDATTNVLKYEGMNRDVTSPIVWESYSIIGGGPNYVITGGTKIGQRTLMAWDGGAPGMGTIKMYYTKNKANDNFVAGDEVATLNDINSIIIAEAGIYLGNSETETALKNGIIDSIPVGHTISNNDWAYVKHYDEPIKKYTNATSYVVGEIIEYNYALYKVKIAFTSSNWSTDYNNLVTWNGNTWTFIYRTDSGWAKGSLIDTDNIEPDNVKLTTTFANKMTIKDQGVDTVAIKDSAVTTAKINDSAVTTAKIVDGNVTRIKLDNDLKEIARKGDTMWYSENLIVSAEQPATPETGYILWVNANPNSI